MILIDDREGSKHFAPLLTKIGIEVELTRLDFGDLFFVGRGEGGASVDIGIEFKELNDLISSIRSERLQGHQLPGMRAAEEGVKPLYDYAYLLIEGELVYDARGLLMRRTGKQDFKPYAGKMTIGEMFKRVQTMHLMGGLNPMFTRTQRDSVRWIEALYRTWTDKNLDAHTSHLAIYTPKPLTPREPSIVERIAAQIPGISWGKAQKIAKHFQTPLEMARASEETWKKIPGIGDELARKAVQALRGNTRN